MMFTGGTDMRNMRVYLMRTVNILTIVTMKRQVAGIAVALLLVTPGVPGGADAADTLWHPVEDITAAAENYLKLTVGASDDRLVPTAGYLDPRLQLPRCNAALEPYLRPGTKASGRIIVGVRCTGPKPWKVYLPVHVAVMENILVARRSLPRDHQIQTQDVERASRDVSGLAGGYLSQIDEIIGHRLKQTVARGVVITPGLLQTEVLIKRGQSVILIVRNGSLNIRMSGKALMDGAANQRIKVENIGSGRVVEGLVRSAEQVEVLVN